LRRLFREKHSYFALILAQLKKLYRTTPGDGIFFLLLLSSFLALLGLAFHDRLNTLLLLFFLLSMSKAFLFVIYKNKPGCVSTSIFYVLGCCFLASLAGKL
jgi:hypothetical protein